MSRKRDAILMIYKRWIVRYGQSRLLPETGFHTARHSRWSNPPGFLSRPSTVSAPQAIFSHSKRSAPPISMSVFSGSFLLS